MPVIRRSFAITPDFRFVSAGTVVTLPVLAVVGMYLTEVVAALILTVRSDFNLKLVATNGARALNLSR